MPMCPGVAWLDKRSCGSLAALVRLNQVGCKKWEGGPFSPWPHACSGNRLRAVAAVCVYAIIAYTLCHMANNEVLS